MPVKLVGLFVVCYLDNPFMKTLGKYLIIASSFIFTLNALELLNVDFWVLCVIGMCLGLFCLILEVVKVPENIMCIIYEIISVFAAIGMIGFFSGIIIDFITFLAFYFSLD